MDYHYNKFGSPKVLKILFKMSAFSVLACFLAIFAGSVNGNVEVRDDNGLKTKLILTNNSEENVKILKDDEKVKLGDKDSVSFFKSKDVKYCYITRAFEVKLKVYKQSKEPEEKIVKVEPNSFVTVENVLQNAQIELGAEDELTIEKKGVETKPEKEGGLSRKVVVEKGMTISVKKVYFEESLEQRYIDYKTEERTDANLEEGKTRVEVKGEKGVKEVKMMRKVMCGDVIGESQQVGEERVVKEPKNEVIVKGIKKKHVNQPEHNFNKKNNTNVSTTPQSKNASGKSGIVYGFATSYNCGTRTSRGTKPGPGTVAGDPSIIPYGASVKVTNSKTGKTIYEGKMLDHCPTAVRRQRGVVVDLYGARVGRAPVKVEWTK